MYVKTIFIFLLLTFPCWATQYYVSTTGNDSNDGLSIADAHAWLTIQHAANTAVAGDKVDVLAGSYVGAQFNINDGTSLNPITFETYQSGTVIVNPYDITLNPIFIPAGTTWTDLGLNTAGNAHKWASPNNTITNSNTANEIMRNHSYWFAETVFPSNYFGHGIDPWFYYDSANKRILLNQPTDPGLDEWVVTDGSSMSLFVQTRYMIFDGFTVQYSHNGLRTVGRGNNITGIIDDASHNIYRNIIGRYNGLRGMSIDCEKTRSNTDQQVIDSTFYTNAEHGFKQEDNTSGQNDPYVCTNFVINHIISHGNGYHGIQISNGGDDIIVENSISYDNGINPCGENMSAGEGCATWASEFNDGLADNITWKNNEGYSTGTVTYWGTDNAALIRPGFSLFSNNGVVFEKNYLHDNHGPGVYGTENGSFAGSNNIIRNNIIIYSHSNYDIYLSTLDNTKIYNNTVGGGDLGAIDITIGASSNAVKNNAFFTTTGIPVLTDVSGSTTILDYNAWYSPDATPFSYNGTSYNFADYKTNSSQDAHSIAMDFRSEFTNFAGKDFSITYSGAPDLRDAGINLIPDSPDDYTGRLRPQNISTAIGAYEEEAHNPSVSLQGGNFNISIF